jgi:hypothetical protein
MRPLGRDDRIRTCDHTPPRRVLYRAELHPVAVFEIICWDDRLRTFDHPDVYSQDTLPD